MRLAFKVIPVFLFVVVTWLSGPIQQPAIASVLGQESAIGQASASYIVKSGDTLFAIASKLGTTVAALGQANNLTNPDFLYVGQTLAVPANTQSASAPMLISDVPSTVETKEAPSVPAMTLREESMFAGINGQRVAAGLNALSYDSLLLPIARARSTDMATRNYFSHTTPEGRTVQDFLQEAGLHYGWASEILARNNYSDDQSVGVAIASFMRSDSHRAHILYAPYTRMAVGELQSANGIRYYTVMLATE